MARAILGSTPTQAGLATAVPRSGPLSRTSPSGLKDRLRQRRSLAYVEAMQKLDAGAHVHDPSCVASLIEAIRQELPDIALEHLPVGIVAKCYLGAPHDVHSLDRDGSIVRHYKTSEGMPALLQRARSIASHGGYAFIEVYADKLIAVSASGDTSLVENKA